MGDFYGELVLEADRPGWVRKAGQGALLLAALAAGSASGTATYVSAPSRPAATVSRQEKPAPLAQDPVQAKAAGNAQDGLQEYAAFIAPHEGRSSKAYRDSRGKLTIGIGFNLDAPGAAELCRRHGLNYTALRSGMRIDREQMDALFQDQLKLAIAGVGRTLKSIGAQPQAVRLVLTDMVFNMGAGKVQGFTEMIRALEKKDYAAAAKEMENSHWYHQVGARAERDVAMIRSLAGRKQTVQGAVATRQVRP